MYRERGFFDLEHCCCKLDIRNSHFSNGQAMCKNKARRLNFSRGAQKISLYILLLFGKQKNWKIIELRNNCSVKSVTRVVQPIWLLLIKNQFEVKNGEYIS